MTPNNTPDVSKMYLDVENTHTWTSKHRLSTTGPPPKTNSLRDE